MAHALSGRRFQDEFLEWFLLEYTRGRGTKHMAGLIFTAAEFLIELFCEVWATQGQTNKIPVFDNLTSDFQTQIPGRRRR